MVLKNDLRSVITKLLSGGFNIKCVYDIGANKGNWTKAFLPKIPNAQFILFEANPNHSRPVALDQKHKWFNVALTKPGVKTVDFYSITGTGDSYYKEQTRHYDDCTPILLPAKTLDELAQENRLPYPQLIKLDTQGSELDILRGGTDIIKEAEIIVSEIAILPYNEGAPTFTEYVKFFDNINYVPVGVEGIHFANGMLVQLDIVFLRKDTKVKYYGDNKVFVEGFKA